MGAVEHRYKEHLAEVTGGQVTSVTQVAQMKAWLEQHDVEAAAGQLFGHRRADPVGGAGDERPRTVLVCEFHTCLPRQL